MDEFQLEMICYNLYFKKNEWTMGYIEARKGTGVEIRMFLYRFQVYYLKDSETHTHTT